MLSLPLFLVLTLTITLGEKKLIKILHLGVATTNFILALLYRFINDLWISEDKIAKWIENAFDYLLADDYPNVFLYLCDSFSDEELADLNDTEPAVLLLLLLALLILLRITLTLFLLYNLFALCSLTFHLFKSKM